MRTTFPRKKPPVVPGLYYTRPRSDAMSVTVYRPWQTSCYALSTPILRGQSARAREFAWVRLCKARRLVRLPVRAVHVITSPSRAPWRIPSPNPPLKPHVDDGGVVRGSRRTLMRDCLYCRPHGFNVRADHVGGVARRLDIGSILRRDLLAVIPHHAREFDHFLARLAAYVLGTFPERGKQCLTLGDHLLRRFISTFNDTERGLDGFIAAG